MTSFNDYSIFQHFVAGKCYPVSLNFEAVKWDIKSYFHCDNYCKCVALRYFIAQLI